MRIGVEAIAQDWGKLGHTEIPRMGLPGKCRDPPPLILSKSKLLLHKIHLIVVNRPVW